MKDARKLAALKAIAEMKKEVTFRNLACAAARRDQTRAALVALDAEIAAAHLALQGGDGVAPLAVQRHELWAWRMREQLNIRLAGQTADWLEQRAAAAQAFGRAQVIAALEERAELSSVLARQRQRDGFA